MSTKYRVLCGVPAQHCTGGRLASDQQIAKTCHGSHEDAFRCMCRYLVKVKGYERVGGREFAPPDGGPILVLTKKSRFGGHLRAGKAGDQVGMRATRFMPQGKHGTTAGLIF